MTRRVWVVLTGENTWPVAVCDDKATADALARGIGDESAGIGGDVVEVAFVGAEPAAKQARYVWLVVTATGDPRYTEPVTAYADDRAARELAGRLHGYIQPLSFIETPLPDGWSLDGDEDNDSGLSRDGGTDTRPPVATDTEAESP